MRYPCALKRLQLNGRAGGSIKLTDLSTWRFQLRGKACRMRLPNPTGSPAQLIGCNQPIMHQFKISLGNTSLRGIRFATHAAGSGELWLPRTDIPAPSEIVLTPQCKRMGGEGSWMTAFADQDSALRGSRPFSLPVQSASV